MGNQAFRILDCALIAIATGMKAQNLREFRDHLRDIDPACIYYHFWGNLLNSNFEYREYQNDFAVWASNNLHDSKIAEQLSVIDPKAYDDIEGLRQEVIEIIEERLSESEHVPWVKSGLEFHFLRSQIVIFDTGVCLSSPEELPAVTTNMTFGSLFFHFIDSRRRTPDKRNDFSVWLAGFGDKYSGLIDELDRIDPYFTTLHELREEINTLFCKYFGEVYNEKSA